MAGLLDGLFQTPSDQALWALGSGLLGVRRGNEGRAFMGAMGAYNDAQQEQRRNSLVDLQKQQAQLQLEDAQRKRQDDEALRSLFANPAILKPGQPEIRGNEMDIGQPAQPASVDMKRVIQTMIQSGNPALIQKAIELQAKNPLVKVGKGDVLLDPDTNRPVFSNNEEAQWVDEQKLPDGRIVQRNKSTGEVKISGGASTNVTVGLQSPYAGVDSQGNPIVVQPANRPGVDPQVLKGPDGKPIRPTPPNQAPMDAAAMKQVTGVKNLQGAVAEYLAELKNWNATDTFNMSKRAAMGVKYNNMMLQAKEAYNLGVLNGPDFQILTSVVTDPRSLQGLATPTRALAAQATELSRIMESIGKTVQDVHQRGQKATGQSGAIDYKDLK